MLRKKIAHDERVAQLSVHSALLYVLTIPHLDVDGRIEGSPVAVRGIVVPALVEARPDEWTDALVADYIAEWTQTLDETSGVLRPLALGYRANGMRACTFEGFRANQQLNRGRERPSSLPPPPDAVLADLPMPFGAAPDADSGVTPEQPQQLRMQAEAEAEAEAQDPPDQRDLSRPRELAALPDEISEESPLGLSVLAGVERRQEALSSHGPLARLLEVLPDADERTPATLHAFYDPLGPTAIEHARAEILSLAGELRSPAAYAVGIAKRLTAARDDPRPHRATWRRRGQGLADLEATG